MLVSTYTDIEKLSELKAEGREVQRLIEGVIERPGGYLRAAKKATTYPFTYYATFKTANKNRYRIVITATDKRKGLKNPMIGVFALMNTETSGAELILCDEVRNHYTIFSPHFLQRFRERCLKTDRPTDFVIDEFIERNKWFFHLDADADEYNGVCADGLIKYKRINGELAIAKTYYSPEIVPAELQDEFSKLRKAAQKLETNIADLNEGKPVPGAEGLERIANTERRKTILYFRK